MRCSERLLPLAGSRLVFAYELPADIVERLGGRDLPMCCSDYPHSEGTTAPLAGNAAAGLDARADATSEFFHDKAAFPQRR